MRASAPTFLRAATARASAAVGILLTSAMLSGCARTNDGPSTDPPPPTPLVTEFLEQYNARSRRLQSLVAYGTVEIRWKDDDGDHFQNADIECVINQPEQTAFRIDKAGIIIFWFGSNADRYWLFDDSGDDTVLITRPHPDAEHVLDRESSILPVPPLALLDLLGMTPLQPDETAGPNLRYDEEADRWICAAVGRAGRMKLAIDPATSQVLRIVLLDDDGKPRVRSRLDRFKPTEIVGELDVNWPLFPTLINIEELGGAASLRLGLDDPTTDLTDQPTDVLFDLGTMMQVLPPDVVDGDLPERDSE